MVGSIILLAIVVCCAVLMVTMVMVSPGEDLYDVTVTDGDCRLRATLDPGLNRLVERNLLRPRATLRNCAFATTMGAQPPQSFGAAGNTDR